MADVPVENIPLPMDSVEGLEEFIGSDTATPEYKSEPWCKRFCRWIPTSATLQENAERKLLSYINTKYEGSYTDIGAVEKQSKCRFSPWSKPEDRRIWTLKFNPDAENKTPLVLIHGLCASAGLWALNVDELAKDRTVYAIDLLGFGRSSRPKFSSDAAEAEQQHVEAIEAWRKEMKIERFVLLGHSMGGFLSSAYALKYPERIAHLVLADPWGYPQKPETVELPGGANNFKIKLITTLGQRVNPLGVLRAAGPYGPGLVERVRPDLVHKFEALNQNGAASVGEYVYHSNAQNPTGEEAFRTMMDFFGWAKNAMQNRIHELKPSLPLTMMYGEKTWLQQISEEGLRQLRPEDAPTTVHIIPNAGHHVYADNQPLFNSIVNDAAKLADKLG